MVSDARAPAVVALLVTRDPGPWFDETLSALAAQTYEEFSVLVMVSGGDADPTDRVAAALPGAFVRRLDEDRGFGAAVNQALPMVEGAAFFLLCHDDCAPDPDAVEVLVEEAYRSNAGVVTPKVVRWDDPSVLVHVGMSADRTGAVVERVQPGEVDHGQHDAVRDVFVAPGGCTLVRADLLVTLGGFDEAVVAMGEDLDLSWRAQVAGSRLVVAPEARVRHLELTAAGERSLSEAAGRGATLQGLQRRHELRAVLKCGGPFRRWLVLAQMAVLSAGELVAALVVRDSDRAAAVSGAWRWNLARRRQLRPLRHALRAERVLSDRQVQRLMTPGVARLHTYGTRLLHQGFDVAHGLVPSHGDASVEASTPADAEGPEGPEGPEGRDDDVAQLTGSVGLAFSEDQDFDDLDDLGHRAGRDRYGRRRRRAVLQTHRTRLTAYLVATAVVVVGTRSLLGPGLPVVGQFASLGSWAHVWRQLFTGWHAAGVGTTAPSTPAFGVLGVAGTVLLGAMGLTQKVAVLGCIPLGTWGVLRLLRPLVSARARLAGGLAYLGLPLGYDALARGRWDGLVAFALVPFMVARLARVTGLPPFDVVPADGPGHRSAARALVRTVVALGVLEAVAVSFAPATAPALVVSALGIVAGSALVGERRGALRALAAALAGTAVAAVLCAPWVIGTLLSGRRSLGVFGLAAGPRSQPGLAAIVTTALGPVGHSPLVWLLVGAAALPLLIGRGLRLAWAARLASGAVASWVLALLVSRGWLGSFEPQLVVVLAPAALGVAACVGLGVAAVETDLSGRHFGWRQVVGAAAVAAAALGLVPVVVSAGGGRWGLPPSGYGQALGFLRPSSAAGGQRVLWLGDPSILPTGGWSIGPGLAYATSDGGLPTADDSFMPAGPGPAAALASDVELAVAGDTRHLGRLLAPAAVRYVVVVWSLAPTGEAVPADYGAGPSPGLLAALRQQQDLQEVPGGGGYAVFEDRSFIGAHVTRPGGPVTAAGYPPSPPTPGDLAGWRPLPAVTTSAPSPVIGAGTVYAADAPAGGWRLTVGASSVAERRAFGWAGQFAVARSGPASLAFDGSPLVPLAVVLELVGWLLVLGLLAGVRRGSLTALRRRLSWSAGAGAGAGAGGGADR